jgi:hypothetical protein
LQAAGVDVARKVKISHVDGTGQVASGVGVAVAVSMMTTGSAPIRLDSCSGSERYQWSWEAPDKNREIAAHAGPSVTVNGCATAI